MKTFLNRFIIVLMCIFWSVGGMNQNVNVLSKKTDYNFGNMKKLLDQCISLLNKEEKLLGSSRNVYLESINYFEAMDSVLTINLQSLIKDQKIMPLWVAGKDQDKLFEFQNLFLKSNEYMGIFLKGIPSEGAEIKKLYENLMQLKSTVGERIKKMLDYALITKPQTLYSRFYNYIHNNTVNSF